MNSFFFRCGPIYGLLLAGLIAVGLVSTGKAAGTLSAGDGFAATVTTAGTLVSWGKNDFFQLGHSEGVTAVSLPQAVGVVGGPNSWSKVVLGSNFTLALGSDSILYSWGNNLSGQLGTGSLSTGLGLPAPVDLPTGSVVQDFVSGQAHALALVDLPGEKGVLFVWGSNTFGQLGQKGADRLNRSSPTRLNLKAGESTKGIRAIATTDNSSFAIASDGTLWAWGANTRGELGSGKKISSNNLYSTQPAQIGKSKTWTSLMGGARHVLGVQGGKIYAWGDNSFGQCARSGSSSSIVLSPTAVTLPKIAGKTAPTIVSLAASDSHSLALDSTGLVYAWGFNLRGELGRAPTRTGTNKITTPFVIDQDDPTKSDPKKRIPLPAIASIAAGSDFTLLVSRQGSLLAYGANSSGQLGLGYFSSNTTDAGTAFQSLVGQPNLSVSASTPVSSTMESGLPAFGTGTSFGNLSLVVRNTGTVPTAASYRVAFYLSADAKLDSTDRLLAKKDDSIALPPAVSRATVFSASDLVVPEVAPGIYYLISQVYFLNSTGEAVPDVFIPDNGSSTAVALVGPDLSTSGVVSLLNTLVEDGDIGFDSVSLGLTNVNIGKLPAGRIVKVEAYLSSDTTLQASSDILLKSIDFVIPSPGLSGGGTLSVDFGTIPVPAGVDGGNYNLLFALNRDGVIAESGTASNIKFIGVRVAAHDLSVLAPVLPDAPLGAGSTLPTVSATVQNLGSKAYTGVYTVELYVSASSVFDFNAIAIGGSKSFPAGLQAQTSRQAVWSDVKLPVSLKDNVYFYAKVIADPGLGDRFPANNEASVSASLEPAAFSFSDFVFPNTTSVEPGSSLGAVTYKLLNSGPGALQAGYSVSVEVFLSSDANLDRTSDQLLSQYAFTAGLAPGAGIILPGVVSELFIPDGVANGIYNLIFAFNADGGQSFLSSTTSTVKLNVGALDLKLTSPSLASSQVGTLSRIPLVGMSVENLGGFAVPPGLAIKLYLSRDSVFDSSDTLIGSRTLSDPVPAAGSQAVSFADVLVPDLGQGDFFLVARLLLPSGLIDTNSSNNVSSIALTLSRPSLALENLITPVDLNLDLVNPTLTGIGFDLVNNSPGVIPSGTPIVYEVFLSRDGVFDVNDKALTQARSYTGGLTGSGAATGSECTIPAFDIPIDSSNVGGSYQLLFVINREGKANLASTEPLVVSRAILFQKTNAPERALDYGVTSFTSDNPVAKWTVVSDPRATGGSAFESPSLAVGETASIQYLITGPTELNVPWKLLADSADTIELSIVEATAPGVAPTLVSLLPATDPNTGQKISDPIYRLPSRQPYVVDPTTGQRAYDYSPASVPAGSHLVTWTYKQNSAEVGNFSRVDLDVPAFTTNGAGDWFGEISSEAKVGNSYARSPLLVAGQQATLEVPVVGPAQVSFWWRAKGASALDTLAFYIDGELAQLPTFDANASAQPAVISNQETWQRVSFLVGGGSRTLRWVYSQGSQSATAQANLDGLSVLNPIPDLAPGSPNRLNDPVESANVPSSNVDIAITAASAPTGTYLLDDAGGKSRLPIRVTFANLGKDYASEPIWDASSLEMRLSTDNIWGNDNDFILGNYARFEVLRVGQEVTFDAEVNLSFDIPDGTYYLLTRIRGYGDGSSTGGEFTLANNTRVLGNSGTGNAYTVRRAPDLRLSGFSALEAHYPYHPEDAVYISYSIRNLGLGPVLPGQPFKVNVSLYALPAGSTDTTAGLLIRSYEDREFSVFLPPASASYPEGGSQPVVHFIDFPSERTILAALGLIDATLPEDDARVYAKRENLRDFVFFFVIFVDAKDTVAESSETNLYRIDDFFRMVPIRRLDGVFVENAGSFFGDKVFSDFLNLQNSSFSSSSFDSSVLVPSAGSFTDYIWDYALYEAPFGSPGLLYQQEVQNSVMSLKVPPYGNDSDASNDLFQVISFDFNVQASDVEIAIQARDDSLAPGVWDTITKLSPPYTDIIGNRSLNGYGGLSSSPYVVSLDGNVSFVQKVHAARITVRDRLPISARGGLINNPQMRLLVKPAPALTVPTSPSQLKASIVDGTIVLNWVGELPQKTFDSLGLSYSVAQGAYVVERARDGKKFISLGTVSDSTTFDGLKNFTFTDSSPGTDGVNTYRVRGINAAGATVTIQVEIALTF